MNIINKQIWEINYFDKKSAFKLQDTIRNLSDIHIGKNLEKVIDDIIDRNSILRINKLEIDLGKISINELERELIPKVSVMFKKQLTEIVQASFSGTKDEIKISNAEQNHFEIMQYFLTTGNLPWWSDKISINELENIIDKINRTNPEESKTFFKDNLQDNHFLKRLVYHFQDKIIISCLNLLENRESNNLPEILEKIFEKIKNIYYQNLAVNEIRFFIYRSVMKALFENNKDDTLSSLIEILQNDVEIPQALTDFIKSQTGEIFVLDKHEQEYKLIVTGKNIGGDEIKEAITEKEGLHKTKVEEKKIEEEFYIENSGLAIIAPYLPRFFENLDLLKNNMFKNKYSADKAINLLQYIATGKLNLPEYFLTLNKILCSTGINEPVDINIVPDKEEINVADKLLESIIRNWKAVKNTSIVGLRNSFLNRKGILRRKGNNWQLNISGETYDILLEQLPWSFSVIKLPWMNNFISVEW